jgi:hypothetical protein
MRLVDVEMGDECKQSKQRHSITAHKQTHGRLNVVTAAHGRWLMLWLTGSGGERIE